MQILTLLYQFVLGFWLIDCSTSLEESQLVIAGRGVNYETALRLCQNRGMKLLRILDEATNSFVYNYAVKNSLGRYWIDANDIKIERQWVYYDSTPVRYTKWYPTEPNNWRNENCVQAGYFQNGFWHDIHCTDAQTAICYSDDPQNRDAKTLHEYQIRFSGTSLTYHEAVKLCKSRGLRLLKIPNEASAEMVNKIAVGLGTGPYWIDGNDIETEGTFVDSEDNRLRFFRFFHNQPDNNGGNEDCLLAWVASQGVWYDVPCYSRYAVFCYLPKEVQTTPTIKLNQLQILNEKVDYTTAMNKCKASGMRMIKIENEADNNLVFRLAESMNLGYYWIDGNDVQTEGRFVYNDGTDLTFKFFYPNLPDNQYKNEHCIHGKMYNYGYWNDINCATKMAGICLKEKEKEEEIDRNITQVITKTLYITEERLSYEDAVTACQSRKLRLIRIPDAEINNLIFEQALKTWSVPYWVDGNDKNQEGKWISSTGTKLRYTNFLEGEPNGGRNENCIQIGDNGKWQDVSCSTQNGVLCFGNSS